MSRYVFDTNTLISHLLLPSSLPAQAVRKGLRHGQLLVSDDTLDELADVLARPKFDRYISLEDRQQFFRMFARGVERVNITRRVQLCRDPKDDRFLELAVNGEASYIITGDTDLLLMQSFHETRIVTPQYFALKVDMV